MTFKLPDDAEEGEKVRFQRRVLFYRALLSEAGFGKPPQKQAKLKGPFNEGLRKALGSGKGKKPEKYKSCAAFLEGIRFVDRGCSGAQDFARVHQ